MYCAVEITGTDKEGNVVFHDMQKVPVEKADQLDRPGVTFTATAELLPPRSPYHPDALTKDDLTKGTCISLAYAGVSGRNAIVVSEEPFKTRSGEWAVIVSTKNAVGGLVHETWLLHSIGAVPLESGDWFPHYILKSS